MKLIELIVSNCFVIMETHQLSTSQKQNLAFLLIVLAQIFFPTAYIYVSQHNFHPVETVLLRGIGFVVFSLGIGIYRQVEFEKSIRKNFNKFLVRNLLVLVHNTALSIMQFFISFSALYTLTSSGPIFVFIWDYWINGVGISRKQFGGVVVGALGVICTINSQALYLLVDQSYESHSKFQNFIPVPPEMISLLSFLFICVCFGWAYSATMIKTIKMKDTSQINYHGGLLLIIFGGLCFPALVPNPRPISEYMYGLLFSSIPMGLSQYLFVQGMSMTKNSGVATILTFTNVIVSYCISLFRYGENINPIAILGSLLIIIGLMVAVCFKQVPSK